MAYDDKDWATRDAGMKEEGQINESMDASMVDADEISTESSFRERLGEDASMTEKSEPKHPSM